MKKLSVIMFFFSLIMIGCAENRVLMAELKESGGLMYYQGEPFTGVAFEMFNESQLREEVHFKDGKKDGVFKQYYPNGQLMIEHAYKNGEKNGVFKWYYENGQLEKQEPYKNGKEDGVFKRYYGDGKERLDKSFLTSDNGLIANKK